MAYLIGMSPSVKGRKFNVDADRVRIGRKSENEIVLEEPSISGTHCVITRSDRRYVLTDKDSTNGTRLNGAAIHEARLNPKDILQIGHVELMFDGDDIEADPATSPASRGVEFVPELSRGPVEPQAGSPFQSRSENRHLKLWMILIGLAVLLVLGGLVFFIVQIFSKSA